MSRRFSNCSLWSHADDERQRRRLRRARPALAEKNPMNRRDGKLAIVFPLFSAAYQPQLETKRRSPTRVCVKECWQSPWVSFRTSSHTGFRTAAPDATVARREIPAIPFTSGPQTSGPQTSTHRLTPTNPF